MNKFAHHKHNILIQTALERIPKGLHKYLDCDFLIGFDPIAMCLHNHEFSSDGRSLREIAHVLYPELSADKRLTVIVPELDFSLEYMVHEFAHVLRHNIDFNGPNWVWHTTEYSRANYEEAFAERFTTMIFPGYCSDYEGETEEEFLIFMQKLQRY